MFPTETPLLGLTVVGDLPTFFAFNLLFELLFLTIDFAATSLLTVFPYLIEPDVEDNVGVKVVLSRPALAAVTLAASVDLVCSFTSLVVVVVVVVVVVIVVVTTPAVVPAKFALAVAGVATDEAVDVTFQPPSTLDGVFVALFVISWVVAVGRVLSVGNVALLLEILASGAGRLVLVDAY